MLHKIKYKCPECAQMVDAERDCCSGLDILPHMLLGVPCQARFPQWEPPKTMTLPRIKNYVYPDIREILIANSMKPTEEE
jgi:hypothetical protein